MINSRRSQSVLSADLRALRIYNDYFLPGYVAFYVAYKKRYMLDDLNLEQGANP